MIDLMKRSVLSLARGLGYEIVSTKRLMPRELASHLRLLFASLEISCVFDVGANAGQYGSFLRDEVGFQGFIVSFEPARRAAEKLKERAQQDTRWLVYPCALGAHDGEQELKVMRSTELSSFLPPDDSMTTQFQAFNVVDEVQKVAVKTFDATFSELKTRGDLGAGFYLKIDTQGYDLEVLRGAVHSLAEIAAVQTEIACLKIYKGMPGYLEVLGALDAHGYRISAIFPISQDTALRIIEADCVLINDARIDHEGLHPMWTKGV